MVKKLMGNFGWAINFSILIGILALIMLIILFIAALFTRTPESKDVLKYFDSTFLIKATNYNKTVLLISIAERFLTWAFMAGIIYIFWKNFYASNRIPLILAAALFALFSIILFLIILPLQYYREFVIDHRFALSNQTLPSWFIDILKDRAISLIINTIGLSTIYALIIYLPKHWWIAAAAIFILFIIIASFISPVIIDPLFYKFSILEDKQLTNEIINVTEKAGVSIGSILVADASKKTNRVNAYFTGVGKTKRIVIYDNLLNQYTKKEVLSVIAHEVGHWKYKHIVKNIAMGAAGIIILFFIMYSLKSGLQLGASVKLVLILFILFGLISYITMPLQNFVSRYFEGQADNIAVELTADPQTQVFMLEKLARSNLANVKPNNIVKYLIYSHPPIMERIKSIILYTLAS
ncbi:MAG: M48 family metallopeptidase [Actinobacteria bacterium]|nr:M48 family metallopeptidase [Actinomycetota bacterium]